MKIVDISSSQYHNVAAQLPYFFLEGYANFEKARAHEYVILTDETQTYIPLKISKRLVFYIGLFTHSPVNVLKPLSAEEEKRFLEKACAFAAKQFNCIRIEHGIAMSVYQAWPEGAKYAEIGLFVIDLQKTEDDLFAAFDQAYRKQIRNAEKNALEIRHGKEELKNFYELYAETHKRQGAAHENYDYFDGLYKALEKNIICVTAYSSGVIEASLFLIDTPYGVYCLYGGSAAKTQLKGSAKAVHWESMKMAKSRRAKMFVFGGERRRNVEGTKFEGIQNFKKRFGTDTVDGVLWKKDLNAAMCLLYDTMFWVKCTLRGVKVPKDIISSLTE